MAPSSPLSTLAARGFAWQVAAFGSNRLVVFASTLVLARLLSPRDFGVFAAALVFTQYLEVVLGFGLPSYLVFDQSSEGATHRLHVAFTFNLLLTVVLSATAAALSPLTARVFGAPHQAAVFAVLSCYLLLSGLSQVNLSIVQRELRFKQLVVVNLLGAVVRAGVSIALAVAGRGVWAIAIGFLAGQVASTAAAWVVVRYRPRLRFDWTIGRTMMRFGLNSVAIDILTELSINSDYVVVGATLGTRALGLYTIAYRLPELVIDNLFWMFSGVAFPVYARARVAGMDTVRKGMLKALRLTTVYGIAAGVGLALVSRDAMLGLFGPQWRPAIVPMMILSLASALMSTSYASGPIFPALGRPGTLVALDVPLTVVRIAGFVLAAPYGIVWVATVHLLTNAVLAVVRLVIADRVVGTTWRQSARAVMPAFFVGVGVVALALPVRLVTSPGLPSLVEITVAGLAGACVALHFADRGIVMDVRLIWSGLAHGSAHPGAHPGAPLGDAPTGSVS